MFTHTEPMQETTLKYLDNDALDRLVGKVLPFAAEYYARHIEQILVRINDGQVFPRFAGSADVMLANNRANKEGVWEFCKDYDLDILDNYIPNEHTLGGKLKTDINVDSKTNSKQNKEDWRVLVHLIIANHFNGTPWQITFPLQMVMKYYPHKTKGTYFGYCHGIALRNNENKLKDHYYYIGVTSRNWLQRMAEHFSAINTDSNKTFHRAWRNHIGRRDVLLSSELVVANHTFDEIMHWEEDLVDRNMEAGTSLNMIPGGFKGMRFLHEHRLTKSPVVSLKERDQAIQEYQKQNPRSGIPNLLVSELWMDDAWAEKVICGPDTRLSPDQIRSIRALDEQGLSAEVITKRVGAKNVLQVKRVLNGETYTRIR